MKQQKDLLFFQQQINLLVWLSLAPGLVYVFLGYWFGLLSIAVSWYIGMVVISVYGIYLSYYFRNTKMDKEELSKWYKLVVIYMYLSFGSWMVAFILYSTKVEQNLHYIAIFTELGASVVASALLVSDRRMYVPILLILMIPLIIYFALIGTWYGYVLSVFSAIFLGVLLYASNNTFQLLKKNYYNAHHDSLTGLYNRRYFIEYMESMIERLGMTKKKAYILLIDLDHFKNINDSVGHDVGDMVLKEVAKRIKSFCRLSDVVARLGGDEFVVVSKEFKNEENMITEIKRYSDELLEILKQPYFIDHHHLYISASIGLSKIDESMVDGQSFLKEADIAMYEAKELGRDGVIIFNKALAQRVERKLLIEQRLYYALNEEVIEVYFQPQFDRNHKLTGCEVLARWDDEQLGEISPNEFIPIAENTGVIIELGEYILERSLKTLHKWLEKGYEVNQFSINISVRQIFSNHFVKRTRELMEKYLEPKDRSKVVFEITESVLAADIDKVINVLTELKALGISLSMDDFGTGYSSLNYLKMLNVDELKIDKTFIEKINMNDTDKVMVETIISIANNFNLKVIIEGVEKEEQFKLLSDYNCHAYQGYYFSVGVSQKAFEEKYLSL